MEIKRLMGRRNLLILILFSFPVILYNSVYAEDVKKYTWDICVKIALKNNPDLLSSREGISQKKSDKGITRSDVLPDLSASVSGGKKSERGFSGSDGENSYSYGITAKQLLFDGFKSLYNLKGADSDIETARFQYFAASSTVRYNLKKAYVSLLKSQEMLKIIKEIQKRRKHILELVKIKYDAGRENRGAYLSARADYLQSRADVKSSEREIELDKSNLAYLLGQNKTDSFSIEGDIILTEKYENKPDLPALVLKNPTYLKAASSVMSAYYNVESSRLAFSPEIYGTASAGKSGESVDNMSGNWSVGFEVTAPLFSGGETMYTYSKAKSAYQQALFDQKSVKSELLTSLEQTWNSLKDSIDDVEVQKAVLIAARERSKIGEARYSIGSSTFDDWTIIESNLASAKKSYLTACATALIAEAEWIQSIGGTLDNEVKE